MGDGGARGDKLTEKQNAKDANFGGENAKKPTRKKTRVQRKEASSTRKVD